MAILLRINLERLGMQIFSNNISFMYCSSSSRSSKETEIINVPNEEKSSAEKSSGEKFVKGGDGNKYSSEEDSQIYIDRVTSKLFSGPLVEIKREKDHRLEMELKTERRDSFTGEAAPDISLPEDVEPSFPDGSFTDFNCTDYENFAAMYSDPVYPKTSRSNVTTNNHGNETVRVDKKNNKTYIYKASGTTKVRFVISKQKDKNSDFQAGSDSNSVEPSRKKPSINTDFFEKLKKNSNRSNLKKLFPYYLKNPELDHNPSSTTPKIVKNNKNTKISKLIKIDNLKFTDVPEMLNISTVFSFPLLNLDAVNVSCPDESTTDVLDTMRNSAEECHSNASESGIITIKYYSSGRKSLPSVSKILSETMPEASRLVLAKWEANMIAELGEEGFRKYKKDMFARGSLLHQCIHSQLQHSTPPSTEEKEQLGGLWSSIENVVGEVGKLDATDDGGGTMVLESRVIHPHLHYAGIVDCVAVYRNSPVLIEWKTSNREKKTIQSTYDNPLQVAAYLGAMQHDPNYRHLLQVKSGLLAFSYPDGSTAHAHVLTPRQLSHYWSKWLERLALFWKLHSVDDVTANL